MPRYGVAAKTIELVARADADSADSATGRSVTTANQTVARRLGISAKSVQRARATLTRWGVMRTVANGRYLTTAERRAAREAHGGRQVRAASHRILTVPAVLARLVHLPRRGCSTQVSHSRKGFTKRARARRRAMPRPTLAAQRLAAGLDRRLPWLVRGGHLGGLARALDRSGVAAAGWTAADLIEATDARNRDLNLTSVRPDSQRSPIGLLLHQISQVTADGATPPSVIRAREAEAIRAEQARYAAAREAQRGQRTAATPSQIDALRRQLRAKAEAAAAEREAQRGQRTAATPSQIDASRYAAAEREARRRQLSGGQQTDSARGAANAS